VDGGSGVDIAPVFQHNLVGQTPHVNGNATVGDNLIGDPGFVGGGDYHLATDSAAIDSGESLPGVTTDCEGTSRPQGDGLDLGAFEYVSP
jgi:hypothetical protein